MKQLTFDPNLLAGKKTTGLTFDESRLPTSLEPTEEDLEIYRRMGVKQYRSPAGKLYDLAQPAKEPERKDAFARFEKQLRKPTEAELFGGRTFEPSKEKPPSIAPTSQELKDTHTVLQSAYSQVGGEIIHPQTGKVVNAFDYDKLRSIVNYNPGEFSDTERRQLGMIENSVHPYTKDIPRRAKWLATYVTSAGGRFGRFLGAPNLRTELLEEAKEFPGVTGTPLAEPAGNAAYFYLKYLVVLPRIFQGLGIPLDKIKHTPRVKKAMQAIEKVGGAKWLAKHFPRSTRAALSATEAFGKGFAAAAPIEFLEEYGATGDLEKAWPKIRNHALLYAGVTTAFDVASSVDRARYAKQLRKELVRITNARYQNQSTQLKAQLRAIQKAKPIGAPRTAEEIAIADSLKAAKAQHNRSLKMTDSLVSEVEAEMAGISKAEPYKQSELQRESALKAAERFARYGPQALKKVPGGREELKVGLGKREPFIKMPTTKAEQVAEAFRDIVRPTKPVKRPPSAAEMGLKPGAKIPTPPAKVPAKPAVPPPEEIDAHQAAEIAAMDKELAAIQRGTMAEAKPSVLDADLQLAQKTSESIGDLEAMRAISALQNKRRNLPVADDDFKDMSKKELESLVRKNYEDTVSDILEGTTKNLSDLEQKYKKAISEFEKLTLPAPTPVALKLDESLIEPKPAEAKAVEPTVTPKAEIVSGYPPTKYKFTGQWSRQELGSASRVARRNRAIAEMPIYESDTGKIILDASQQRIIKKYRGKISPPAKVTQKSLYATEKRLGMKIVDRFGLKANQPQTFDNAIERLGTGKEELIPPENTQNFINAIRNLQREVGIVSKKAPKPTPPAKVTPEKVGKEAKKAAIKGFEPEYTPEKVIRATHLPKQAMPKQAISGAEPESSKAAAKLEITKDELARQQKNLPKDYKIFERGKTYKDAYGREKPAKIEKRFGIVTSKGIDTKIYGANPKEVVRKFIEAKKRPPEDIRTEYVKRIESGEYDKSDIQAIASDYLMEKFGWPQRSAKSEAEYFETDSGKRIRLAQHSVVYPESDVETFISIGDLPDADIVIPEKINSVREIKSIINKAFPEAPKAPPAKVTSEKPTKETWEMTRTKWVEQELKRRDLPKTEKLSLQTEWNRSVENAIKEGKPVARKVVESSPLTKSWELSWKPDWAKTKDEFELSILRQRRTVADLTGIREKLGKELGLSPYEDIKLGEGEVPQTHRKIIQAALKQGKPIPPKVLAEYKSEKWAQEALAKVEPEAPEAPEAPESIRQKAQKIANKTNNRVGIYFGKDKKWHTFTTLDPPRGVTSYEAITPEMKPEILAELEKPEVAPAAKKPTTEKDKIILKAQKAAKKAGKNLYVFQNPQGKFSITSKEPTTGDYYAINPTGTYSLIKGPAMANVLQRTRVYEITEQKGLISKKGKPTQSYRRFAKAMTGKTSIERMTEEEAAHFIDMLDALTVDYRGIAKIPTSTHIITKELADKIDKFRDIGALERFRPAWRVFKKIGLYKEVFEPAFEAEVSSVEELLNFRKEAKSLQKLVGTDKATSQKLFRAMENPGKIKLSDNEQKVVEWGKKFFADWADRLGLTPEQRRKNYVTHIFEKEISELLRQKNPLDPDLIRALDFITPKTVFNPFLQHRLGKKAGLKEDFWSAIQAYENRALKKFYYEPLIQRIRVYEKFLPPSSARYLRNYVTRITSRPLVIDREINQTLKEAAQQIEKLPGGKKLTPYLTKGNASGMLAYNMAGIYYECWLGLRPASAIKNLSQHGLILAETGPVAFTKALKVSGKERANLLSHSTALRSRKLGYLPGIDETFIRKLENKRRKVSMAMFRTADRKNVSDAFLAGYYEAKAKGLPDEWAYKRGDEVAAKTQYLYSKLAGSQFMQSTHGRILGILTTWPENWAELMNDWIQGKPSEVYKDYEKTAGAKIPATNWLTRRKSLWTYLALVSLAMLLHKKTRFKALYYTGWTSIKSLVDVASGKLAGLEIPRIIGNLVAGLLLADKKRLKQSWNEAKRFVVIARELKDIITGKKDWMSLFVYLEQPKKEKSEGKPGRAGRRGRVGKR